jgi:hypothetical protein
MRVSGQEFQKPRRPASVVVASPVLLKVSFTSRIRTTPLIAARCSVPFGYEKGLLNIEAFTRVDYSLGIPKGARKVRALLEQRCQ